MIGISVEPFVTRAGWAAVSAPLLPLFFAVIAYLDPDWPLEWSIVCGLIGLALTFLWVRSRIEITKDGRLRKRLFRPIRYQEVDLTSLARIEETERTVLETEPNAQSADHQVPVIRLVDTNGRSIRLQSRWWWRNDDELFRRLTSFVTTDVAVDEGAREKLRVLIDGEDRRKLDAVLRDAPFPEKNSSDGSEYYPSAGTARSESNSNDTRDRTSRSLPSVEDAKWPDNRNSPLSKALLILIAIEIPFLALFVGVFVFDSTAVPISVLLGGFITWTLITGALVYFVVNRYSTIEH
jgi:hypothetical protein